MSAWAWLLVSAGAALALYAALVLALAIAGRREDARALAGFVPDCAVLFARLLRDPRVPPRTKLAVGLLLLYLAMPFDVVPDLLPVVGQLDDALLVALVLRHVLRAGGPALVEQHWPGPAVSLDLVLRLAGGGPPPTRGCS